jgi:hypothetical protein
MNKDDFSLDFNFLIIDIMKERLLISKKIYLVKAHYLSSVDGYKAS